MHPTNKFKVQCSKYQLAQKSCSSSYIVFISYFHHSGKNESLFLGNLFLGKKIFCLSCTLLQELTIHDHESLLPAEKI